MTRRVASALGLIAALAAGGAWADRPAAPQVGDFEFVTIYEAPRGRSAMYAQLTRLKSGDLLCAFRDSAMGPDEKGHPSPWFVPGSRILCVRSGDDGRTWSAKPVFIFQDKEGFAYTDQCGLGYQAGDGTILVPFYVCNAIANRENMEHPLHQIRSYLARSRDDGRTWNCKGRRITTAQPHAAAAGS